MSGRRNKADGARYDKWYAAGYRSYRPGAEALALYREIKERTQMTDVEIMRAAGLGIRWLAKLKSGESKQVQGPKYQRLLAIRDTIPAPVRVPAVGVQRRLDALHRMGRTRAEIRERLNFSTDRIRSLPPTYLIPIEIHEKVVALYDELSMIPGTPRVASRAAKAGKPGPLAWDDDTIDEPDAKPNLTGGYRQMPGYIDHAKVTRRLRGDKSLHLNKYEAAEVIRVLRRRGVTGYAAEHIYGLQPGRYE